MARPHKSAHESSPLALRKIASELFLEQAAIATLASLPERLTPDQIVENVAEITLTRLKDLREMVPRLRSTIADLRKRLGIHAPRERLVEFAEWLKKTAQIGESCFVPVGMLSDYLSFYSDLGIAPHARIGIDYFGTVRDYPGGFEVRLLEASLFEDMCALFNACREAEAAIPAEERPGSMARKIPAKRHVALRRATVSAAFYFMEGFINCLAADHLYANLGTLTENEKTVLTEWDAKRNRYRPLSTRDKLVQYARIIANSEFPPIDENTCPEFQYFVTSAKDFRDAFVHASAVFDPIKGYPHKESLFISLGDDDVVRTVDSAIAVAAKISEIVYGKRCAWLIPRDETGYFPARLFE